MGASSRRLLPRLVHSFTLKLVLLALVLLSVPLLLYWQFARAEEKQLALIENAVVQANHVLAAMLQGHFEKFASEPAHEMQQALSRAAVGHTRIKILLRLKGSQDFSYVAAMPEVSRPYLEKERIELVRAGILRKLGPSCDASRSLNMRFVNPAGGEEVLAAMTPVHVDGNCWIVITSENASSLARGPIGLPFWKAPTVMLAGIIYLTAVLLVIWLAFHMWRNVRGFRRTAHHIRLRDRGAISFQQTNTIPELRRVAEDFDALVGALMQSQTRLKQAAEESSHALKTPLAVIAQAVEPLKKALPEGTIPARRSITLIEAAVVKLDALVSAHRDLEDAGADMVYPVRQPMDLSRFLRAMLPAYETALAAQGKQLVASIDERVMAYANEDAIEPVIENMLENAASFTAAGQTVEVGLCLQDGMACLAVLDQGPGVPPVQLPHIFTRGASFRDDPAGVTMTDTALKVGHQGLGLWIVKRNVEALGGTVTVRNRARGGFEITVCLPGED
jgi:two-component system sensor histidine kinase ChvG